MLKRKYEELRIDFEQLKLHSTPNPTSFPAEPEKQTTSLGTVIGLFLITVTVVEF